MKAADLLASKVDEFTQLMIEETGATAPWAGFNVMLAASMLREAAAMTTQISGRGHPVRQAGLARHGHPPGRRRLRRHCAVERAGHPRHARRRDAARLRQHRRAEGIRNLPGHAPPDRPGDRRGWLARRASSTSSPTIPKDAAEVVEALIAHPAVRRINFTGSTKVGRIIAETAGRHLKPVLLELGGKAPLVVLDDADIDGAVNAAVFGAFINQGQICMSTERHHRRRDSRRRVRRQARRPRRALPAGDPRGHVVLGSLISSQSAEKMDGLIADAERKGAKLVAGGKRTGTVVDATVLDHVTP